jgi:hypothetical protein
MTLLNQALNFILGAFIATSVTSCEKEAMVAAEQETQTPARTNSAEDTVTITVKNIQYDARPTQWGVQQKIYINMRPVDQAYYNQLNGNNGPVQFFTGVPNQNANRTHDYKIVPITAPDLVTYESRGDNLANGEDTTHAIAWTSHLNSNTGVNAQNAQNVNVCISRVDGQPIATGTVNGQPSNPKVIVVKSELQSLFSSQTLGMSNANAIKALLVNSQTATMGATMVAGSVIASAPTAPNTQGTRLVVN